VLADVQGAETTLLERAAGVLGAGRVRFLVVSTHHHSISGSPLTHQRAVELLADLGAHVICEHSVGESFSGDGLIAVSFDQRDRDLTVEVSRARAKDSLFGELEFDLATSMEQHVAAQGQMGELGGQRDALRSQLASCQGQAAGLRNEVALANRERDLLHQQIDAMSATKLWRWSRRPRDIYARVRRATSARSI
jgi:hypothetical protein